MSARLPYQLFPWETAESIAERFALEAETAAYNDDVTGTHILMDGLEGIQSYILDAKGVTYEDYVNSPWDKEGLKRAYAKCRACDEEVIVCVRWPNGADEVEAYSSGTRRGCKNAKCGDKFPATILRMADLCVYAKSRRRRNG